MLLTRREFPILVANLIYIPLFTALALRRGTHEFLLYVAVILLVGAWVLWNQRRVRFDPVILWGLTLWGLLHMAGGNLRVGGGVLYGVMLIPIVPRHNIFRYDQLVHMLGFGVAALTCHHLLRPYLRENIERCGVLLLLIVLMGSGLGAVNEIIEFTAVLTFPETGVGGYENTLWDLVFNLFGGLLGAVWLALRGTVSGGRGKDRVRAMRDG